jgi:hypothetical protein
MLLLLVIDIGYSYSIIVIIIIIHLVITPPIIAAAQACLGRRPLSALPAWASLVCWPGVR